MLGGFPPPQPVAKKRPFLLLLRVPADPEPHCLRPSSRHFAFVSRKVSGVEMEAERFIIARDVVRCLDWSRSPPIILNSAPSHHPRIPIGQSVLKVDKPPLFIVFIYFYVSSLEDIHVLIICHTDIMIIMLWFLYTHTHTHNHARPVNHCNNFM